MSAPSRRTFVNAAVILGAGLFALGGTSAVAPLRDAEKSVVRRLSLALDPADSAFGGQGSQDKPWVRWKAKPEVVPDPPRFLAVDDDPEGYFSTSPPSPVDSAVLFSRLRDAGHRVIGSGFLFSWEDPDPLALLAFRKQLDRFDSAVLGLPLARGAASDPLPAPFLRLSLPARQAEGDVSALPQVNRVAVTGAELGGEHTLAGFTLLENEADAGDGRRHLLARWQDRIIFSLPLATEIVSLGVDPTEIRILCGKEIRLGQGGPVVPIDEFGRTPLASGVSATDIPATALISEDEPPLPAADPMILRDARSELPENEKAWAAELPGLVQALRAAPRYEPGMLLRRPGPLAELALVTLLALFATWASCLRSLPWRLATAVLAGLFGAELVWLLAARLDLWFPPFAALAPAMGGLALAWIPGGPKEVPPPASAPAPPPAVDPAPADPPAPAEETPPEEPVHASPAEEPADPAPARKAAKKAARKSPRKKGR